MAPLCDRRRRASSLVVRRSRYAVVPLVPEDLMSLNADTVTELAAQLQRAATERRAGAPLSDARPDLDEADAYAIQAALLERRGGTRVGYKLGFTSAAMREQMGVAHPNSGVLLASVSTLLRFYSVWAQHIIASDHLRKAERWND